LCPNVLVGYLSSEEPLLDKVFRREPLMLSHEPATICEGQDEAGAADHLGSPEVSNAVFPDLNVD
jgi:hypothetical protein